MTESNAWWHGKLESLGEWVPIAEVGVHSLVRLTAYSSENNHYQPWEIYFMTAYPDSDVYPPRAAVTKIKTLHEHSADVEWRITKERVIEARKAEFTTSRTLTVIEPDVMKGSIKRLDP